jgi:hypothetical protein
VNTVEEAYDIAANFIEATKSGYGNTVVFAAVGNRVTQRNNNKNKTDQLQEKERNTRIVMKESKVTSKVVVVERTVVEERDLDPIFLESKFSLEP